MLKRDSGILLRASPFETKKSQNSSAEVIPPGSLMPMPTIAIGETSCEWGIAFIGARDVLADGFLSFKSSSTAIEPIFGGVFSSKTELAEWSWGVRSRGVGASRRQVC
ncbi:hypothetical protein H113_06566 [Trichophyton rubrum MR1459]|nr:hypothetical protein H113_06566 [Trichophyton rubrum MR1459]